MTWWLWRCKPPPDDQAYEDERDAHRVPLRPYFLARYPVTVAQWRLYYEAVERGAWRPTRPDGLACEPLDPDSRGGARTQPVVVVSWYDALDYCQWLTAELRARIEVEARLPENHRRVPFKLARVLGQGDKWSGGRLWVVTLPSDAEWEKGARGPRTAWRFPWGDGPDPNNANGEWNIEARSAAGCFKGGRSPYDVEDLSGNVREWTRSLWDPDFREPEFTYPYKPDYDAREREDVKAPEDVGRVVRGGSSLCDPEFLRSAYRSCWNPRTRDDGVGFRVVVSPFAFDPLISDRSDL